MGVMDRMRSLFGGQVMPMSAATSADAQRKTDMYWRLALPGLGAGTMQIHMPKPTPRNLRQFARTPYARRAINAIKNPIAGMAFDVVPKPGVTITDQIRLRADALKAAFNRPNPDDSFRSLIEQVMEDTLIGAGAIEQRQTGNAGQPFMLWPVDGLSIDVDPHWDGDPRAPRYAQGLGQASTVSLRNDELIYFRVNPTTYSPFGLGPLEVAFQSIARQLAVADYAGKLAANARPNVLLNLGTDISADQIQAFRGYWRNDIEGQGMMPIIGGNQVQALPLTPEGDDALFLSYQDWMVREIATCFDLSPQNMGLERDINRSTADAAETRDWDQAIRPFASLIAAHLNRDLLHGLLGEEELEFRWIGLDRIDEVAISQIWDVYYRTNLMTPNEMRHRLGLPALDSVWADNLFAQTQQQLGAGVKP